MSSIKKNFIFNSILTLSNYIFPLLTFPYATRVLGVNNIGSCSFVDSIISFYLLFATLGVSIVGVREIAKSNINKNKEELSHAFSNIFIFNSISTILALLILIISIFTVPQFESHEQMLYIGGAKILATLFLIEWFYKGIEDFKYITVRSVIVKALYVISVFIFVKEQNDYILYFGLTTVMVVFNSTINWLYKRKYVTLTLRNLSINQYLKPIVGLGLYTLLTSMYTTFNVLYLGFSAGEKEVGYYVTAIKLYTIILGVFTAFTTVMLPRMSSLIAEKNFSQVEKLVKTSFDLLLSFCIPLVFISVILAPQIIFIIAGEGYEGAIIPMQIIMPLILIIGIAQVLIIQILMPMKEDKSILISSIVGASISIILNIMVVSKMGSVGSAISLLASESAVTACAAAFVHKKTGLAIPVKLGIKHILVGIPYIAISLPILFFGTKNPILQLTLVSCLSIIYFIFSQTILLKNTLLIDYCKNSLIRFKSKK